MQKESRVIFDTSALFAIINKEKGYELAESVLAKSSMSSVNVSEVVAVLTRAGLTPRDIREIIEESIPYIIDFDEEIAFTAGVIISESKSLGLSLGDRACIATGMVKGMEIYTADQVWTKLDIPSAKIKIIR